MRIFQTLVVGAALGLFIGSAFADWTSEVQRLVAEHREVSAAMKGDQDA